VVGHDAVEVAGGQRAPQPLPVGGLADGRAALELGGAVADVLGIEGEVVGAGLGADAYAVVACGPQRGQRARAAEVDDVRAAAAATGGGDDAVDRGVLGGRGPGGEEAGVPRTVEGSLVEQIPVLGMDEQERVEPGGLGEGALELGGIEVAELLDAGVEQEALEAEDARGVQAGQVGEVARDRAAPEAGVDVDGPPCRGALGLQVRDGRGRRDGVERHVDDRGDSAGGRGASRGGEPLPLGAAGLVDVDVGVDESGQQHLVGGQDDGAGGRQVRVVVGHLRDSAVGDPDRDRDLPPGHDRPLRADQQVELSCHGRWSSRRD